MARNEEKARGQMNRWVAMKEGRIGGNKPRARYIGRPAECTVLSEAEQSRRQIMRAMSAKIEEIQNAGLGEHVIKELNDGINQELRNKRRWEKRIIELGGPNYIRLAPKVFDSDGRELPGDGGYKYFGAARNLPIVQRLFKKRKRGEARRTKGEIMKRIKPNYFGLGGGGESEALLRSEAACEASARAQRKMAGHDEAREVGEDEDYGFAEVAEVVEKAGNHVTLEEITANDDPEPDADLEALRAALLAKLDGK
jgi:pre-mRNA-splicing factor ISY1